LEETQTFIIANAVRLFDALVDLPECNNEELWKKPDKWAVKKEGSKKAWRVFDSEEEAFIAESERSGYIVEHRPSKAVRCGYCNARSICDQYKELKEKGLAD
jgi:hypothetical protein